MVLFYVLIVCTVTLPPGVNPIAVDKYIYLIPGDRNVIKKEADKISKYKDLIIDIKCPWNVKAKVIPEIIGATGTISESLRQYLSNITEKHKIKRRKKK